MGSILKEIYLDKKYLLTPHGLGMSAVNNSKIEYLKNFILFNDKKFDENSRLQKEIDVNIRERVFNKKVDIKRSIENFLKTCPGEIICSFETIFSYNSSSKL